MNMNKKAAIIFMFAVLTVLTGYFALQVMGARARYVAKSEFNWVTFWETSSELTAYIVCILSIWAIPLEILAVAIIILDKKAEKPIPSHDKMFEIIYAFQGLGFFAALFWGSILDSLIPPPPPPSGFYYTPHAPGLFSFFLSVIAFSISALSFLAAYGFLKKRNWAEKVAFALSLPSVLVWSFFVYGFVTTSFVFPTLLYISLAFLALALAVANAIVVSVLAWRYMITHKAR